MTNEIISTHLVRTGFIKGSVRPDGLGWTEEQAAAHFDAWLAAQQAEKDRLQRLLDWTAGMTG